MENKKKEVSMFLKMWGVNRAYSTVGNNLWEAGKPYNLILVSEKFADPIEARAASEMFYLMMDRVELTDEEAIVLEALGEKVICVNSSDDEQITNQYHEIKLQV